MSATSRGEQPDPLAAALNVVLRRRGQSANTVDRDELAFARHVRDVAQVLWMQAGEPGRLRSEDEDRAGVCHSLVRKWSRPWRDPEKKRVEERERRLRLVPPA